MPDKKYNELRERLEKSKKSRGNFRSYEKMRQDAAVKHQKARNANERGAPPSGKKKPKKSSASSNALYERFTRTIIPALIVVGIIMLAFYALTVKNASEISINGEAIGQVKGTAVTKEDLVDTLTKKIEQIEETSIRIMDEIAVSAVHGSNKLLKDDSQMLDLMAETVSYQVLAAEISIDGAVIGVAKNQAEAEAIFNQIMSPYITNPETTTGQFVQDVLATDTYLYKDQITPSDTIRAEMTKTTTLNTEYTIEQGDTLSKIAAMNGMTMSELKDANPGLDPAKTLRIGDKLNIVSTMPAVSVLTTETKTEIVDIPMDVIEQKDPSIESGKKKIIQQGKPGKKEIVSQVTKINGVKTSEDSVAERIIEPAQSQIVAVGG